MELTTLAIACKYLNLECREPEINKLHKQKHAAHSTCYRLRKKLEAISLANKILTICFIKLKNENETLKSTIIEHLTQLQHYIDE